MRRNRDRIYRSVKDHYYFQCLFLSHRRYCPHREGLGNSAYVIQESILVLARIDP